MPKAKKTVKKPNVSYKNIPMMSNNPTRLSRNPPRREPENNFLSLTRSQFTATSPLQVFSVYPGSTAGGTRVRGRELVGAVTVPINLGVYTPVLINGLTALNIVPNSFPRLVAYAGIYEFYIFHSISLLFQSSQPTTVAGEFMMAADYDATDAVPGSAVALMRNISSTMSNIYSDSSLQILGSLSRAPRYVTQIAGPALDLFQANVWAAVEGFPAPAAVGVGYIVVQYDVEFFTPQ